MSADIETSGRPSVALSARPARALLRHMLAAVRTGRLTVVTPEGEHLRSPHAGGPGREARLVLHDWRALRAFLSGGEVGFAQAYLAGDWSSPDLPGLLALADANAAAIRRWAPGLALANGLRRLRHGANRNSRRGSRRNIAFHYDLGNDFYRLWLDDTMSYSSALYRAPDDGLEHAQDAKIARILELMELRAGQSVLEIGCGWGTLARRLAGEGAQVTAITLSQEQLAHARAAAEGDAARGGERPAFRLEDYRDVAGQYDRLVSIEMLEAVGEAYWPVYFDRLRALMKPGGRAVIQVITIAEDRFEGYRRTPDFIQRHVFPGGMLPTDRILAGQAQSAGLRVAHAELFGLSYARTLAEWRRRFHEAWPAVERLGFGPEFRRLWDYYLAYCEAGFRTRAIDVGLYVLEG